MTCTSRGGCAVDTVLVLAVLALVGLAQAASVAGSGLGMAAALAAGIGACRLLALHQDVVLTRELAGGAR